MKRVKNEKMTPMRGNFGGRDSGGDASMATSDGSTPNSPEVNEYDTPPEHVNDLTPSSSRSRGQLRASSLNINPSIAHAMNSSPSRRSSPKHLPPPIRTDTPTGIPIKLPGFSSLPNASNTLNAQPISHGFPVGSPRRPVSDFGKTAPTAKDPRDVNPYLHRADEIGPTHRIAGVGHLGVALVPPGWNIGDEPISPERARELYDEARKAAVNDMDVPMSDEDDLSPEEREKRRKAIDRKWTSTFKKDELVLKERIEIHKQYHLRKISSERLRALALAGFDTSILQHPPQSPTSRQLQALKQSMHNGIGMPPPSPRARVNFSGQVSPGVPWSTQNQGSLPGYPAAGTLDPALITESVAATLSRYAAQQEELLRKKNENEQMLSACFTQYMDNLTGPISPGVRSPVTGAAAGPFASVHTGYVPKGSHQMSPRPLPYVSPTRSRFSNVGNLQSQSAGGPPPNMTAAELWRLVGYPKIPAGTEHQGYGSRPPSEGADWAYGSAGGFGANQAADNDPVQLQVPPEKRKRAHRTRTAEKEPMWYADQLATLPTSEISAEAMAKGEAWKQSKTDTVHKTPNKAGARKPSTSTPTKASKKRGKPEIDPAVGFTIPAKAARSLLDRGWVKMSTRSAPVPGSSITPGSTITDNANVVARVPQNQMSVTASGAAGLVDTTRLQTTTEDTPLATATHQQTTNISQLPVHGNEAPALSASHSTKGIEAKDEGQSKQEDDIEGDDEDDEGSQSESSVDDPADKSWGNRRKSTTPRKRKSTGQRSKRSRRG